MHDHDWVCLRRFRLLSQARGLAGAARVATGAAIVREIAAIQREELDFPPIREIM